MSKQQSQRQSLDQQRLTASTGPASRRQSIDENRVSRSEVIADRDQRRRAASARSTTATREKTCDDGFRASRRASSTPPERRSKESPLSRAGTNAGSEGQYEEPVPPHMYRAFSYKPNTHTHPFTRAVRDGRNKIALKLLPFRQRMSGGS